MSLSLNKPRYKSSPIRSTTALSRALGLELAVLVNLANTANGRYRSVKPKAGSTRETFDAIGILKDVHARIKDRIFCHVYFPDYLQGSLKGRDYVSNARLHAKKKILICEDVKKFFPSVSSHKIQDVWSGLLGFSKNVSDLLTALTTKDGSLPQGAITSSFLANLVLWRDEPLLHAKLEQNGITYSRYVDDICMSAHTNLDKETQSRMIAQVYGMLKRNGLNAGREKHQIFTSSRQMIATKLIVNGKPSLTKKKRSQVRSQVHQLERMVEHSMSPTELIDAANKAAQQVGQLGRFHSLEAQRLKQRIQVVRNQVQLQA